jgi:SH3-like domain-containing protein
VQLGESRGDWRRIRAKGLSGWVEQRAEFRTLATGDPPALATRARR